MPISSPSSAFDSIALLPFSAHGKGHSIGDGCSRGHDGLDMVRVVMASFILHVTPVSSMAFAPIFSSESSACLMWLLTLSLLILLHHLPYTMVFHGRHTII